MAGRLCTATSPQFIILKKTHSKIWSFVHKFPEFNIKNQIPCLKFHHLKATWAGKLQTQTKFEHLRAFQLLIGFFRNHTELQAAGPQIPAHLFLWMAAVSWQEHPQVNFALTQVQRSVLQKIHTHQNVQNIPQKGKLHLTCPCSFRKLRGLNLSKHLVLILSESLQVPAMG